MNHSCVRHDASGSRARGDDDLRRKRMLGTPDGTGRHVEYSTLFPKSLRQGTGANAECRSQGKHDLKKKRKTKTIEKNKYAGGVV
jgi:hypothetical protein